MLQSIINYSEPEIASGYIKIKNIIIPFRGAGNSTDEVLATLRTRYRYMNGYVVRDHDHHQINSQTTFRNGFQVELDLDWLGDVAYIEPKVLGRQPECFTFVKHNKEVYNFAITFDTTPRDILDELKLGDVDWINIYADESGNEHKRVLSKKELCEPIARGTLYATQNIILERGSSNLEVITITRKTDDDDIFVIEFNDTYKKVIER